MPILNKNSTIVYAMTRYIEAKGKAETDNYKQTMRKNVLPYMGLAKLSDITRHNFQTLINHLYYKRRLSAQDVKATYEALRATLCYACRTEKDTRICFDIKLPKNVRSELKASRCSKHKEKFRRYRKN